MKAGRSRPHPSLVVPALCPGSSPVHRRCCRAVHRILLYRLAVNSTNAAYSQGRITPTPPVVIKTKAAYDLLPLPRKRAEPVAAIGLKWIALVKLGIVA